MTSEEKADVTAGAFEGTKEAFKAASEALSAWETGGMTAAVVVGGIGLWKAVSAGLARANRRKKNAQAPQ